MLGQRMLGPRVLGRRRLKRLAAALVGLLIGGVLFVAMRGHALATASPAPVVQPVVQPASQAEEPPYLTLALDDGLAPDTAARPGQAITYTFAITNPTGTPVTNVRLIAVVPTHTQPTTAASEGWSCATVPATDTLRCERNLLGLAGQATAAVTLPVCLDARLPLDMTAIELLAVVTADEIICGECGQASLTTPVDPDAPILPAEHRLFLPLLRAPQP